jgi:uncharacterized protein YqhQ
MTAQPEPPAAQPRYDVGGQAVIEGVMMRSPHSFVVVCRRPDKSIVIKEDAWRPIWRGLKFLRWPFLRGAIVLVESLHNGFAALSFAARQQETEEDKAKREKGSGDIATYGMFVISILFGLALFVGVPHLLSWALGSLVGFSTTTFTFHIVDGVIKVGILVGYMAAISLLPDIKRVFQYHGAEHKAIFTYERRLPLTVENARAQSRFHPRCGTSFLLIVVLVSVLVFAATLRGRIIDHALADNLIKILIKLPLMLPVAGLSYELLKLSGRVFERSRLARAMIAPGLWLQRITTREPDDSQIEIALISIRKALWREAHREDAAAGLGEVVVYEPGAAIDLPLG